MKAELIVSVLIFIIRNQGSYSQALSCNYHNNSGFGYICELTIYNPNGFNNFTEINGTHLTGMTDSNVRFISSTWESDSINIPSIICEIFKNVTRIELISMGIKKIDEYSFKSCRNLIFLNLKENWISTIDEKSFSENTVLQTLYLLHNQLTSLPENLFSNQQNLQILWFDNNQISNPPKNVFDPLINLLELDWRRNQVKNITIEWFVKLENLKRLLLYSNEIEELPMNSFSSLKNLNFLGLDSNNIKIIHADSFGILPKLKGISFNDNLINAVDEKFIDNTGITYIYMDSNLCVNITIRNSSTSREEIIYALQNCFNNYLNLGKNFTFTKFIYK